MDEKDIRNVVVFIYLFGILCCCRGAEVALSADVADPSALFCSRNTLLIWQHARDFASVSASLGRWKWTRLLHQPFSASSGRPRERERERERERGQRRKQSVVEEASGWCKPLERGEVGGKP